MSRVTIDLVRAVVKSEGRHASAWRLGFTAYTLAADILINPYRAGTRAHHSFVRGFLHARDTRRAGPLVGNGGAL